MSLSNFVVVTLKLPFPGLLKLDLQASQILTVLPLLVVSENNIKNDHL
jgi:hypothetical protein